VHAHGLSGGRRDIAAARDQSDAASSSASRPNGGDAQPTSTCPLIAWVKVTALAPVATGLALTPSCLRSASRVM